MEEKRWQDGKDRSVRGGGRGKEGERRREKVKKKQKFYIS